MSDGPRVFALTGIGMVSLRGDLAATPLQAAVEAETGFPPPPVRRILGGSGGGVAWMSPDELMLFCPGPEAPGLARRLGEALGGHHHLALDMSDARAVFRVEGPGARAVLAKGAPVDLDARAFGPGDFRRTRLGQVACAFWMTEDRAFELVVFRSVGGFVAAWLGAAARPGSLPVFLPD